MGPYYTLGPTIEEKTDKKSEPSILCPFKVRFAGPTGEKEQYL